MASDRQLERWQRRAYRIWAMVGILVLLVAAGWILSRISSALIPFIMAFVLVFLLAWPVRLMESRGLNRKLAAALAVIGLVLVVGVVMTFVVPLLARQLVSLALRAPLYLARAQKEADAIQSSLREIVMPAWARKFINSAFAQLASGIASLGKGVAAWLLKVGSSAFTLLIDGFVALVIAFWFLRDLPTIREEIRAVAGERWRGDVDQLFHQIRKSMGGYLRGQTIASFCTGVIATIGLLIVGIPYALLLGALAFVLNYIPYVGPVITGAVAALVGLFISPFKALLGILVVVVAQQITDNLITPRVMSAEVNLHPTLIIFSLLTGAALFGIPGMLFAIPVAAAVQGAFVYYYERMTQSQLTSAEGALFRAEQPDEKEPPEEHGEGGEPAAAEGSASTGDSTPPGGDSTK